MSTDANVPVPLRVSIVEDDAGLRASLCQLIDAHTGYRCVSVHPNAEHALLQLAAAAPHVVLMDINLPNLSGIDCARELRERMPQLCILMLTVYEDSQKIFESLRAGADGYLLKRASSDQLMAAVREVYGGGSPMSPGIARLVVNSFKRSTVDLLTSREREVLDLLEQGLKYREVAEALGLRFETVKSYVRDIYYKLRVASREEALRRVRGAESSSRE